MQNSLSSARLSELNRLATREGVNQETGGKYANLVRRSLALGYYEDAISLATKAIEMNERYADHPEIGLSAPTLRAMTRVASGATVWNWRA